MSILIISYIKCIFVLMKDLGMLYIISAPSGTGKSTLIQSLIKSDYCYLDNIKLSISYTTRSKRSGELDGIDYYFVSIKEFKYMISTNMFLEYARVFDHYYGTLQNSIQMMLTAGKHVILDIDWNGVRQVRNKISNICTILILPPSKKELERRLKRRAQDTKAIIAFRMKKVIDCINHIAEYDYIVVNDNFNVAFRHLQSIILSEQSRYIYQKIRYEKLINSLLVSGV